MRQFQHTLVILFFVASNYTILAQEKKVLTLKHAIALAHKNREILEAFKQNINAKKMLSYEALSGYLPNIYGHANANIAHHQKGIENAVALEGKQLLYSPAGPIEYYNVAKQETAMAKHALKLNYDLVRYNVEVAFLKSWLIAKRQNYIKSLQSMAKTELAKQQKLYEAQMGDDHSLRSSQIAYARHCYEIDTYGNDVALEQRILQRFVGHTLFSDEEHPDIPSYSLLWRPNRRIKLRPITSYYELARTNRKDLAIKESEIKRDTLLKNLHVKKYLPSAYLVGGLSAVKPHAQIASSDTESKTSSRVFDRHFGLRVEWKFFDGLGSYFRSRGASARALRSTMEKLDLFGDIKMRIQTIYYRLKSALKEAAYLSKEFKHCADNVMDAKRDYTLGLEPNTILPEKKKIAQEARYAWLESRVHIALLERELAYVCGYPSTIDT